MCCERVWDGPEYDSVEAVNKWFLNVDIPLITRHFVSSWLLDVVIITLIIDLVVFLNTRRCFPNAYQTVDIFNQLIIVLDIVIPLISMYETSLSHWLLENLIVVITRQSYDDLISLISLHCWSLDILRIFSYWLLDIVTHRRRMKEENACHPCAGPC